MPKTLTNITRHTSTQPSPGPNDLTLQSYADHIAQYLENTSHEFHAGHEPLLRWINASLQYLAPGSKIFEIGSGHGRDAQYMISKGFNVTCSDGTPAFVEYLNAIGLPAIAFNILKDTVPGTYDMVYANSVFPHFTPDDLTLALKKIHPMLGPGGILAFSAKQGSGEGWVNEKQISARYIKLWQRSSLVKLLRQEGFKPLFLEHDINGGDLPHQTLLAQL